MQSVTLDTWKAEKHVTKMRMGGGNAAFNQFLRQRGVPDDIILGVAGTSDPKRLQQKYHSNAAMLWRERAEALVDGVDWIEPPAVPYKDLSPPTQPLGRRSGGGGSPIGDRAGSPASRSSPPSSGAGFLKSLRGAASRAVGPQGGEQRTSPQQQQQQRTQQQQQQQRTSPQQQQRQQRTAGSRAQADPQQHSSQSPPMGVWAALERAEPHAVESPAQASAQRERSPSRSKSPAGTSRRRTASKSTAVVVDLSGTWEIQGSSGEQERFVLESTGSNTYLGRGNEGDEQDQF
eukprot:COSAG06_NODE_14133_length_1186_cov_0.807728_1_plen_289_part_10